MEYRITFLELRKSNTLATWMLKKSLGLLIRKLQVGGIEKFFYKYNVTATILG